MVSLVYLPCSLERGFFLQKITHIVTCTINTSVYSCISQVNDVIFVSPSKGGIFHG